ncbi:hypothetical protein L249_0832 [Ophiocordyceps polyrhachis-furcata BCC 54312]|uniref:Uncharacterized protein n=1 Tax=Ophiocordyceps polyrhachis-furcata BCC 54312 TaxID=1330021 RepID=A0A367LDR1_9HYPO|nr:hypothetical protein L249_0832 [Ophiocordyceps polyrhachis-furcata BCC 54312]
MPAAISLLRLATFILAIFLALLVSLPRLLDLRNPEDEVTALRISYEILLDILDMLVNEGDLTISSKAIAMLKVA